MCVFLKRFVSCSVSFGCRLFSPTPEFGTVTLDSVGARTRHTRAHAHTHTRTQAHTHTLACERRSRSFVLVRSFWVTKHRGYDEERGQACRKHFVQMDSDEGPRLTGVMVCSQSLHPVNVFEGNPSNVLSSQVHVLTFYGRSIGGTNFVSVSMLRECSCGALGSVSTLDECSWSALASVSALREGVSFRASSGFVSVARGRNSRDLWKA
jgi:hypothetical protein